MTGVTRTGSTGVSQDIYTAGYPKKESVSVKGSQININAAQSGTILDEYRENGVDLELSGVPESIADEDKEKTRENEQENRIRELYQEQVEAAKEAAEAMGEEFKDMARAMEIARRLMHGDRVPGSDEKFLMDFDKDMYLGAKTMQALAQNKDSKDYDSLLEDEEEEGAGSVQTEGGDVVIDASGLNLCQTPQKNSLN